MARGDMMIGPGGVVKHPRSESQEIERAMVAIQDGNPDHALTILRRLHRQVGEGYHRNPYTPFRVIGVMSDDVHSIAYKHAKDGKLYKHDFGRGTAQLIAVERHGKHDLIVTSPDGVPLWDEF